MDRPESLIVGTSDAAERLRGDVERLAAEEGCVLFRGEPGTGKRLAAFALHALSRRYGGPFLEVRCDAFEEDRLDAELFGREAAERAAGLLERAAGGTLLLQALEALPLGLQGKLLAVIESGRLPRGGGAEPIRLDVRVLAASRGDLAALASEGRFREELLRALAAGAVAIPSLRERRGDVAPLARHFVEELRLLNDLPPIRVEQDAILALERYRWPGNVRELRSVIEQAILLAADGTIRLRDLPEGILKGAEEGAEARGPEARFRDAKRHVVESFEKRYLEELLARHRGNVTTAATDAGMLRSALQRLLRKYGLRSSDFRREARAPNPR